MIQILKSKILWPKSLGKGPLWGSQPLQEGCECLEPVIPWIYSLQQSLTPKAAQPRCKAPLKPLLHEGLRVCVILLPRGRAEPALQEEFTNSVADGFILPFPDSRGIRRSSKTWCQCTRKMVWQKCACVTPGGCPDTGIDPLGWFFGHLRVSAALPT